MNGEVKIFENSEKKHWRGGGGRIGGSVGGSG